MDHLRRSRLNCFAAPALQRMPDKRRDESWLASRLEDPRSVVIAMWRSRSLIDGGATRQPALLAPKDLRERYPADDDVILLGEYEGRCYFAVDLPGADDSIGEALAHFGEFQELRGVAPLLHADHAALLAYAHAMSYWHRRHRFCGDCGQATRSRDGGAVRVCTDPQCARQQFPRTDPAIIVLVTCGERCLLGRQASWPPGMYSSLAGFVEPGESLEDAVIREVDEEAGVRINDVYYHSSQPWPFPASIMLGFTALADNEAITLNDGELDDARWFSRSELEQEICAGRVQAPTRVSIAYRLLEDWFDTGNPGALAKVLKVP